jgi:hypothetical protein
MDDWYITICIACGAYYSSQEGMEGTEGKYYAVNNELR